MSARERRHSLIMVAAVWLTAATAATLSGDSGPFERLLVPISVSEVPGAYGSVWSTELWYRNNSSVPVAVFPLEISDAVPTTKLTELLRVPHRPPNAPGQFLFLSPPAGDQVQFDLKLLNSADPVGGWGTRLPVVRESEFGRVISLINVPTASAYRCALRVYGLPEDVPAGEVLDVRIYSYKEKLLASVELPFDVVSPDVPVHAAMLSLGDSLSEIRQVDRVRVEVESRSGRAKIWAFVAAVSNATQNVSVITPR